MRASRLLELLLLLQLRPHTTAPELAAALEVSVRTVYRDIEALAAAGVPLYTEPGRRGGVRLQAGYRAGGLPHLDDSEARAVVLAAVPAVARDLGIEPAGAEQKLLTAMAAPAEAAARSVRDRLLVEPEEWFRSREPVPWLLTVARGVWEARDVRLSYRRRHETSDRTVRPLGLVLKGATWYLLARSATDEDRLYRVARITAATLLEHRFDRPAEFDLEAAWTRRKREFAASIPRYDTEVRVAPEGERLLHLLQEGTPRLPLPADVPRDQDGWAHLQLRFERPDTAARLLLQLGPSVEVLAPDELRQLMAQAAAGLCSLYGPSDRRDRLA